MDSKEKQNVWIVGLTVVCILLAGCIIAVGVNYNDYLFTSRGYTATTLTGHMGWEWTRDCNCPR